MFINIVFVNVFALFYSKINTIENWKKYKKLTVIFKFIYMRIIEKYGF